MNQPPDQKDKQQSFLLEKWFLDVVTGKGDAYIFYAARMKWHKIRIPYKSSLYVSSTGQPVQKTRFYHVKLPAKQEKRISWGDRSLKVEGKWQAIAPALQAQLLKTDQGDLQWNCFQPSSRVSVIIDNKKIKGLGYAEQLILNIKPWKIPVSDLRWGRFISDEHYLVWIEIKNGKTNQWLWYDGERLDNAVITDHEISIPSKHIHLVFSKTRKAETFNNIKTVLLKILKLIPGFKKSIPAMFLLSEEHKWVSRGELYQDGLLESEGWVIHERVHFKH